MASAGCASQHSIRKNAIPKAGAKDPIPNDRPIRIGIIGVGGMGNGHMNAFMSFQANKLQKVHIVALSDVCKTRLDACLKVAREKQKGVTKVEGYRDYKKLLARDDIDAVVIASPEHWHAQMAVDAIHARKDVYLEKPMTLRLQDALWLEEVMDANPDMRLQVGTQYMTYEKYHTAKKWIKEGRIGKPVFSQTSYCRNSVKGEWLYGIDPKVQPGEMLDWEAWCGPLGPREWDTEIYHRWRRYRDFSTGIVGDLLVHMMTPMFFALDVGWPVRVIANGGNYIDKAMQNHDMVNMTIEFEKEHTMIVAGSTCNENGLTPMIRGHEGNLSLSGNQIEFRPERIFADNDDPETVKFKAKRPQDALRIDWLESVRTRRPNISQVQLAAKVMVGVDLATRSMWEKSAFAFDPKTRSAKRI